MLILVRKAAQTIWIEGGIRIQVLEVGRDRVKLGITAPNDVRVMRRELLADEFESPPDGGGAIRGDWTQADVTLRRLPSAVSRSARDARESADSPIETPPKAM